MREKEEARAVAATPRQDASATSKDDASITRAELLGGLALAIGIGACMLHWAVML